MQQWNRLEYPFSYLFLKNLSLFKKFTNNKISRQRIRSTRDEVDPIAAIPRFERIETSEEYAPLHICLINISRICRTNENRFVYPRPRKQGAACWNITGIRSRGRITPYGNAIYQTDPLRGPSVYPRFLASNSVQPRYTHTDAAARTQVISSHNVCVNVQRSGTRAVMRSFLLTDFHPETMINYFWCSGLLVQTSLSPHDGNLFPRFLGKAASRSAMSLIRPIGQFHGFSQRAPVESRTVVEFSS